jgi:molecular chaperone DnaK
MIWRRYLRYFHPGSRRRSIPGEIHSGDTFLGGDDFDQHIIDWLADEFKRENGINLREDRQALQRLKEAAERAKIELSTTMQAEINLPYITADASGPKHLVTTLTRSKLEQLTSELVQRSMKPVQQALNDANLNQPTSTKWSWSAV